MIAVNFGGGPVGIETIAAGLSEPRDAIEDIIEPYMIQQGFIQRTPRAGVCSPPPPGSILACSRQGMKRRSFASRSRMMIDPPPDPSQAAAWRLHEPCRNSQLSLRGIDGAPRITRYRLTPGHWATGPEAQDLRAR